MHFLWLSILSVTCLCCSASSIVNKTNVKQQIFIPASSTYLTRPYCRSLYVQMWTEWGQWSACSITCGRTSGQQIRLRFCRQCRFDPLKIILRPAECPAGDKHSEVRVCRPIDPRPCRLPTSSLMDEGVNWVEVVAGIGGGAAFLCAIVCLIQLVLRRQRQRLHHGHRTRVEVPPPPLITAREAAGGMGAGTERSTAHHDLPPSYDKVVLSGPDSRAVWKYGDSDAAASRSRATHTLLSTTLPPSYDEVVDQRNTALSEPPRQGPINIANRNIHSTHCGSDA